MIPPDIFSDAAKSDPYLGYAEMRGAFPVCEYSPHMWTVARYDDCKRLLLAEDLGRNFLPTQFYRDYTDRADAGKPAFLSIGFENENTPPYLLMDPPGHTALRAKVVASIRKAVKDFGQSPGGSRSATVLASYIREGGDFVAKAADAIALTSLHQLLGLPASSEMQFFEWAHGVSGLFDLDPNETLEQCEAKSRALEEAFVFFDAVIEDSGVRTNGLLAALMEDFDTSDLAGRRELASLVVQLVLAGHETTSNTISNMLVVFANNPGEFAALRSDRTLGRVAVEEVLRFEPPAHSVGRVARRDLDIGEQTIREGDAILLLVASANRDETRFDQADRFSLENAMHRSNRPLSFGGGIHYCVGASIARIVLLEFVNALCDLVVEVHLDSTEVLYKPGMGFRGPAELHAVLSSLK